VTHRRSARPTTRRIRIRRLRVTVLLVVVAAIGAALGHQVLASSSSTAATPVDLPRSEHRGAPDDVAPTPRIRGGGKLDPALVGALRQAAADAEYDGVEWYVQSGWRSPEHQQELLQEAISKYGSEEEAARWVATPETSPHVSGDAVDLGPAAATAWLSEHGAEYGLCQIYGNEPWHYELRPEAIDHGCPAMYADPTHDPRMQR
jgi:LAS superfamily LD-carboxypeptidase LdcB